jgi:cytochrome c biogenesis protein CcdA
MELFFLLTAIWLGILTSISPCPLATNIAAISFISHRITHKNIVFLSGILYTVGRSITYIVIGFLIVEALVNIPVLSDFLQRYINKILGIVLIIVGMVLLDLLRINLPSLSVTEKTAEKVLTGGFLGSLFLGILFALAFCPVSAALFFGGLIPIAIKTKSGFALPLIAVCTGLPVLIFALLVSAGIGYVSSVYSRVTQVEFYTRKVTGVILILVGIYYVLSYIFEII